MWEEWGIDFLSVVLEINEKVVGLNYYSSGFVLLWGVLFVSGMYIYCWSVDIIYLYYREGVGYFNVVFGFKIIVIRYVSSMVCVF